MKLAVQEQDKIKVQKKGRPFPVLMLNATMNYLLALILTTAFYSAVTIIVANEFRIPVEVSFNGLLFPISDYSSAWTADAIRLIFISGPAACLVMGFVFLGWSINLPGKWFFARQMAFWFSLHGFNLALGGIVAGVLTSSGFAWFAKWIYLNETARFFISLLSIFLLAGVGMALVKPALKSAPSLWFLKTDNRGLFLFSGILIPWIISAVALTLIRFPVFPLHDLILLATPAVIIATIMGNHRQHREEDLEPRFLDQLENGTKEPDWRDDLYDYRPKARINWIILIIIISLLITYRLVFGEGVIFG